MEYLRPENAFIFRITHEANVAGVLEHGGLSCQSASQDDPNYEPIGNADLIGKRARREVPIPPGGMLSDYVPFYFTPHSIMMYNILTGHGGITKRAKSELVLFVSSLYRLRELGLPFVFTNQHAYPVDTEFFDDLDELHRIDWMLLRNRNFKTNDADPGKQQRYQAEALVHQHVPLAALLGIRCYDVACRDRIQALTRATNADVTVKIAPELYF